MWKCLGCLMLFVAILKNCDAQMTTTTSMAPSNIVQNVSVSPSKIVSFTIPGGRLLGLFSLLTSLSHQFGGGFVGRCFGAAKKLRLLIPFFLYKLGVITTTLGFLTIFTLKGLVIGVILLVLNAGGWLAKLGFAKGALYGQQYGGWHGKHSQPPVHIHVHKDRHDHSNDGYISYNPSPGYGSSYDSHSAELPVSGGYGYGVLGGHGGGSGGWHEGGYDRLHSVGGSGPEYDALGSSRLTWAERISRGFDVGDLIGAHLKRSGHAPMFPKQVKPQEGVVAPEPADPIR